MSLAAYVVARSNPGPSAAELRRFMRQSLPSYMIPSRFVTMDALPMTPNRKVDRNALPEPDAAVIELAFAAPEGERETRLANIWKEVLNVRSVGQHDNFHDLGGHSLLMAKLITRIHAQFGRQLTMASVFNAPTLRGMAALLGEAHTEKPAPRLVNVQPNGTRPPLYWLFGGPTVRPLAEAMGQDQPFFGVALDIADQEKLPYGVSLADIAAPLARTIREAQPNGPYFIGGWCTAGIVAYEVSRQLMAEGCEVGLTVMVHSTNPVHYRRITKTAMRKSKIRHHMQMLMRHKGRDRWTYAMERVRGIFEEATDRFRAPDTVGNGEGVAFNKILDNAALHYAPEPFAGDIALFQPADRPDVLDYRPGWREVVRGAFASFEIPGAHRTMLEAPYVAELAARMNACLRRAQLHTPYVPPLRKAS